MKNKKTILVLIAAIAVAVIAILIYKWLGGSVESSGTFSGDDLIWWQMLWN